LFSYHCSTMSLRSRYLHHQTPAIELVSSISFRQFLVVRERIPDYNITLIGNIDFQDRVLLYEISSRIACTQIYNYFCSILNLSWPSCSFILDIYLSLFVIRGSVFCLASSWRLDERGDGERVPVGSRIFSSPRRPGHLWSPPNLLSDEYGGSFPGGRAAEAWSWPLSSRYWGVKKMWIFISAPHAP
jgi:hypothetical protein